MKTLEEFGSKDRGPAPARFEQLIGSSPALEAVLEQVRRVAPTGSTVLIQGETGTGKEFNRSRDSQCELAMWTAVRAAELRGDSAGSAGE